MTEQVDTALERGIYRHYKGREYELLWVARHSETEEWLVVYRPRGEDEETWVRPLEMFVGVVRVGQREVPRFQHVQTQEPRLAYAIADPVFRSIRGALRQLRRQPKPSTGRTQPTSVSDGG